MNARVKIIDVVADGESLLVTGSLDDPMGRWTTLSVAPILPALRLFASCVCVERRLFTVFNITEVVASTRKEFTVRVVNAGDLALAKLTIPVGTDAFVCSTLNGVDDVPDGGYLGISPALTAWARTYGLSVNLAPAVIQICRNMSGLFPNLDAVPVSYTLTTNDLVGNIVYLRTAAADELIRITVNDEVYTEGTPTPQLTLNVDRRVSKITISGSGLATLTTAMSAGRASIAYRRWMAGYTVTKGFATMAQLFPDEYPALLSVPLETFATTLTFTNTASVRGLFAGCASLVNPPAAAVPNTVTDFSEVFAGCTSAEAVHTEDMDVSNATALAGAFSDCASLKHVDLSRWSTTKCRHFEDMFNGCSSLVSVATGTGWSTAKAVNMQRMFMNCSSLAACPVVINCSAITNVENLRDMFKGTTVPGVTLVNLATSLRGSVNGVLLRGDNMFTVTFA